MQEVTAFLSRQAFRQWLFENGARSEGIWLLFGKKGGPATLTAAEALEEALCFGWIDGKMQSIDVLQYKKYFARRTANSKWSEKNKALVEKLEREGRMCEPGRQKVEEAKQNGQWDAPKAPGISDAQIESVARLLKGIEPAYTHFMSMSPSVKRTYTGAYLDAKTEAGRQRRFEWMVERLTQNLKPM